MEITTYSVEVTHLYRKFIQNGLPTVALNDISFNVEKGEIFGVLGPNGAGKTTLIKVLSTMLLPSSGTCQVLGKDINNQYKEIRRQINFIYGGEYGVYGRLTASEYIRYFCFLYHIPVRLIAKQTQRMLKLVNLQGQQKKKIWGYSKGMIERLHIARALINSPKVIFLDEPTIGLDPDGALMLRTIIKSLSQKGITILITTHYMNEADYLCNRVIFLDHGEIKAEGTPRYLKEKVKNKTKKVEIVDFKKSPVFINENENKLIRLLKDETISDMRVQTVSGKNNEMKEILRNIAHNFPDAKIRPIDVTLEDAYFYYVGHH